MCDLMAGWLIAYYYHIHTVTPLAQSIPLSLFFTFLLHVISHYITDVRGSAFSSFHGCRTFWYQERYVTVIVSTKITIIFFLLWKKYFITFIHNSQYHHYLFSSSLILFYIISSPFFPSLLFSSLFESRDVLCLEYWY